MAEKPSASAVTVLKTLDHALAPEPGQRNIEAFIEVVQLNASIGKIAADSGQEAAFQIFAGHPGLQECKSEPFGNAGADDMTGLPQKAAKVTADTHFKPYGQPSVLGQLLPEAVAGKIGGAVGRQRDVKLVVCRKPKRKEQGFTDVFAPNGPDGVKNKFASLIFVRTVGAMRYAVGQIMQPIRDQAG